MLDKKIEHHYRWEYRKRAMGIKPFSAKKLARFAPALLLGFSKFAVGALLVAHSAPALAVAGAMIGINLLAMGYSSVVVKKEFDQARRLLKDHIASGHLLERYKKDVLEKQETHTAARVQLVDTLLSSRTQNGPLKESFNPTQQQNNLGTSSVEAAKKPPLTPPPAAA